jgi:hypothetical protein
VADWTWPFLETIEKVVALELLLDFGHWYSRISDRAINGAGGAGAPACWCTGIGVMALGISG